MLENVSCSEKGRKKEEESGKKEEEKLLLLLRLTMTAADGAEQGIDTICITLHLHTLNMNDSKF